MRSIVAPDEPVQRGTDAIPSKRCWCWRWRSGTGPRLARPRPWCSSGNAPAFVQAGRGREVLADPCPVDDALFVAGRAGRRRRRAGEADLPARAAALRARSPADCSQMPDTRSSGLCSCKLLIALPLAVGQQHHRPRAPWPGLDCRGASPAGCRAWTTAFPARSAPAGRRRPPKSTIRSCAAPDRPAWPTAAARHSGAASAATASAAARPTQSVPPISARRFTGRASSWREPGRMRRLSRREDQHQVDGEQQEAGGVVQEALGDLVTPRNRSAGSARSPRSGCCRRWRSG